MEVMVGLGSLGLGKYEASLRENRIDETVLPNLTAEDLKDLGVSIVGHRRKILDLAVTLKRELTEVYHEREWSVQENGRLTSQLGEARQGADGPDEDVPELLTTELQQIAAQARERISDLTSANIALRRQTAAYVNLLPLQRRTQLRASYDCADVVAATRLGRRKKPMKRVGIHLRVSTSNGQTTENQRRELEASAKRSGWDVVEVFEDKGISGAKGHDNRPAFDRLL